MRYYQKAVYRNKRWEPTRKAVMQRDRGICFFCGKLVLKRATIHHLTEINEKNFQDEDIAFNLDNLVLCHSDCHDRHHKRFGYKDCIVDDDLNINYERRMR